jgi:glycosyltransferase involved in cell wall biosynthesis
MQDRFPEISIYIPQSMFAGIEFVFKYFFQRIQDLFIHRTFIKFSITRNIYYPEFKKFNPDIVISQGHIPKNNYGVPIIWEIFFIDQPNFRGIPNDQLWDENYKNVSNFGKSVTIISVRDNYSAELIKKTFPEFKDKVKLLPFYLPDIEFITEKEILKKHSNADTIKLLFVGREANRKGLDLLIEATEILIIKCTKKFELNVVSAISDGKIKIPEDLPIKYYHTLPHNKVLDLFRESHIYVMPSKIETFGLTYIEGMANGCAVVARDFQPQRDMLDYGKSGVLVPPENPEVIADYLLDLINNDEKRLTIAINGWNKFKNAYYWKPVAAMWISVFKEILQQKGTESCLIK